MIRVCLAGATGWTGQAIAKAILEDAAMSLVGAVARRSAGQDVGEVLGVGPVGVKISATIDEALRVPCDVLVDYTSHLAVRSHVDLAVTRGVGCVVGSSGLTEADYAEIDAAARRQGVGVVAAGNFSAHSSSIGLTRELVRHTCWWGC
jgi:4-hydroxy-tetrahydrodipicolinate reductase